MKETNSFHSSVITSVSTKASNSKFKTFNQNNFTKEFTNKKQSEENKTESANEKLNKTGAALLLKKNKQDPNQPKVEVKIINDLNEQNSFLNSVIHVIYHIQDLRENFFSVDYPCNPISSLLFELKVVLEKYDQIINAKEILSEKLQVLDPRDLRRELAKLFESENKFQMKLNDDPIELLFVFINAIHSYVSKAYTIKYVCPKKCNPVCVSHRSLWLELVEEIQCDCGAVSRPMRLDYNYYISEMQVKDIFNTVSFTEKFSYVNKLLFYYKSLNALGNTYLNPCPEKELSCSVNKTKRNLYLLNNPNYYVFSLSWKQINPKLTQICNMFLMTTHFFINKDIYEIIETEYHANFELTGLICYWATKYCTILKKYDGAASYWVLYRDMEIIRLATWRDLIEKCLSLHLHPVMLLYRKLSKEEKAGDAKTALTNEEILALLKYANCFDEENDLLYKSEIQEKSKVRPSILSKSFDPILEKSMQMLKDKLEVQNSKFKFKTDEDYQREFEEEMRKIDQEQEIQRNAPKVQLTKVEVKKDHSRNFIPDLAEEEWECENEFCKNVNSYYTHYCLKCRKINYAIKDIIIQRNTLSKPIQQNSHLPYNDPNPIVYSSTENSRKNTLDNESNFKTHNQITNPNDFIKSPTKNGKYIDLSARLISPPNRHMPISYISTLENQKPAKNTFRKSNNNNNSNNNTNLTNNLYNISYLNNNNNIHNNSNFNNSTLEPKNNRINFDINNNNNNNYNKINIEKFSTLQVKKIENYNSLGKRENENYNPNLSASIINMNGQKLKSPFDKKNFELGINQINLNLIDYNKIKNNTLTNFHSNRNSQEKEIHGILKKSSEGESFKSRYSLSNGFKDKKVSFHDNLVSYEKSASNVNSVGNNNLLVSSEFKNNNNDNNNFGKGYNFIDKSVLARGNSGNNNRNNIYGDKNIYNKNINLRNNYVYEKNNVMGNSVRINQ